jgi:hypothetical protein
MAADNDYYDVWLEMLGRTSRPGFRALLLSRAGVALDPDLAQYLVTIGLRGPIGVLELADLLGQNHPKASRSLARLEQLGLVQRAAAGHDRRATAWFKPSTRAGDGCSRRRSPAGASATRQSSPASPAASPTRCSPSSRRTTANRRPSY